MDYCSIYFGKSITQLTYSDIENFFSSEKTETDQIEFKSYSGTLKDNYPGLIRTVCAFLNSKGGVLIFGSPAGVTVVGRKEKVFTGTLTPITEALVKDQIISKISDGIFPMPSGLRLTILTSASGQSICVFEIDESDYPPHQYQGTYFMRLDGQTRPAPHHYIEALFKKIKFPNVEGFMKFNEIRISGNNVFMNIETFIFNWTPFQIAEDLKYRFIVLPGSFVSGMQISGEIRRDGHSALHYGEPIREALQVKFTLEELRTSNSKVSMMLSHSAKNAPAKSCKYEFDFAGLARSNTVGESFIIERRENVSYKDLSDVAGYTRESILRTMLGRSV